VNLVAPPHNEATSEQRFWGGKVCFREREGRLGKRRRLAEGEKVGT